MNIENSYWYFRNVIPKNICDDIIKFGLQQNKEKAIACRIDVITHLIYLTFQFKS